MTLTFKDAYIEYYNLVICDLKKQSIRTINDRLKNHILPYVKNINIYEFKKIDYLKWQKEIEKKQFSYKYLKTLHTTFVTFLNFCVKYYDLNENVASKVGNFKNKDYQKKEFSIYNYEEFKKFEKNVDNVIYKYFFEFIFFTGLRPGEAMALKFSDLNENIVSVNKTISERCVDGKRYIGTPKTLSSYRDIIIDDVLKEHINSLKYIYDEKYYILGTDYYIFGGKKPLATTTINRYKYKAAKLANLKNIRLHDFRHSHATLLLNLGLPINEISRRLGHSNISTTLNIYVHNDIKNEKRVLDTLNSLKY